MNKESPNYYERQAAGRAGEAKKLNEAPHPDDENTGLRLERQETIENLKKTIENLKKKIETQRKLIESNKKDLVGWEELATEGMEVIKTRAESTRAELKIRIGSLEENTKILEKELSELEIK